jgi:hypothetical protein
LKVDLRGIDIAGRGESAEKYFWSILRICRRP